MPLVRGLDGCVVIPAQVANVWAPLLRAAMREATRRDGVRYRDDVWAELEALEEAAAQLQARRAGVVRDVVPTTPASLSPDSLDGMGGPRRETDVGGAAEVLGCSPQAVTARIRRGTLPARKDDRGRYLIRVENLNGEQ